MTVTLQGRVFKRYRMGKQLYFCDLVAEGPQVLSACFNTETLVAAARSFTIGDLVGITGVFEETRTTRDNDHRVHFLVESAVLLDRATLMTFDWTAQVAVDWSGMPSFAIQADFKYPARILDFLSMHGVAASLSTGFFVANDARIILVYDADETTANLLRETSPLSQCMKRLYPLSYGNIEGSAVHPNALTAASLAVEQVSDLKSKKFRVSCFPRDLSGSLIELLTHEQCCPKTFTHLLSVVSANGLFYASVVAADKSVVADIFQTACGLEEVSRAENKLEEIVHRAGLDLSQVKVAVDVGAAPGGWSNYLGNQGVLRVIAVDNGLLRCMHAAVEHWKMLGDEAIAALKRSDSKIDMYVCDANISPPATIKIFEDALPLIREGGIFVITLKNTCRSKEAWLAVLDEARSHLEKIGTINFRFVHLIANTNKETTVYGRICRGTL